MRQGRTIKQDHEVHNCQANARFSIKFDYFATSAWIYLPEEFTGIDFQQTCVPNRTGFWLNCICFVIKNGIRVNVMELNSVV